MTENEQDVLGPEEAMKTKELVSVLTKMAEANTKEQEVKRHELDVRQQEITSNERIAMAAIDAQKTFHSDRWTKYNSHLIHRYVFFVVLVILSTGFAGMAIWLGAKDVVMDLAKLGSSLALGTFGGYHWGKNKTKGGGQEQSE
ncbi:hypothetical protein [Pseudomonas syringae]|uniref:hypothetical protein n=1 Tax=Pseudomonas syringae TaxID=317 RepID=UPI000E32593D|nr:hypothetical protein [Pseudomonas syringae]